MDGPVLPSFFPHVLFLLDLNVFPPQARPCCVHELGDGGPGFGLISSLFPERLTTSCFPLAPCLSRGFLNSAPSPRETRNLSRGLLWKPFFQVFRRFSIAFSLPPCNALFQTLPFLRFPSSFHFTMLFLPPCLKNPPAF